jgi:hypothetical protein
MKRVLFVLGILIGVALIILVLTHGVFAPAEIEDHSATSSIDYWIDDGSAVPYRTFVGLHVEFDDNWETTEGSQRSGFIALENPALGCDVVVIVAAPTALFPHHMEDRAGSLAILAERAPGAEDSAASYVYPTEGGGSIELLSQVRVDAGRTRMALAREFGAIDSAIFIDFGCDTDQEISAVFAREFVEKIPAFVSTAESRLDERRVR